MQDHQHKMEELQAEIEQLRRKVAELEQKIPVDRVNEAIRRNVKKICDTLGFAGEAAIVLNPEGKILVMNKAAQKLAGCDTKEFVGKLPYQVFHSFRIQNFDEIHNFVNRIASSGDETIDIQGSTIISSDKTEYLISGSASLIRGESNETLGVLLIFRDVTNENAILEEISLRKEAFQTLTENSMLAVSMTDENGLLEIWNPAAEKITGIPKEEAIGKPFYKILSGLSYSGMEHETKESFFKDALEKVIKTGEILSNGINEITYHHKNGNTVTIRQVVFTLKTKNGFRLGTMAEDITHNKLAEQQYSESEKRFLILAENLPGVVYLCRNDETYSMLFLNSAVFELTGYTSQEFLKNQVSFVELYHPDDVTNIFNTVNEALENKKSFHLIYRIRHKDGSWRWIEEWGTGVWDGENLRFLEGFLADITGRKHAEEEFRESQERFKRLVEHSPDIIYSYSSLRGGSYHSSRVSDVLGYTPQQLKNDPRLWENSVHPDDLPEVLRAVANTAHGFPINVEYRIRSASGEWRWLHDRSMHLFDNKGELLIEGIATDITERKLTEEKLLNSKQNYKKLQELFRNMADIIPDMLWAKDLNNNYIFVNKSLCKNLLNAKDTDEPIGKGDMFFAKRERETHAENPNWHTFGEVCRDSDEIVLQTGKTTQFDEFGNVKGNFLFLDVIKTPFRNEKGELIGVVGTARDVTENKKAEYKLKESEANLKAIIENSLENIWSINVKYEIQYINAVFARSFEDIFGIKLNAGTNVIDVLPEPLKPIWKERYDRALGGEQFDFQDKIDIGEASVFVYIAMNPIIVDNMIMGVSIFGRDITERVLAEEKLVKAKEKAEQSDRLKLAFINNISHEIRTPLNGILGFGHVLAEPGLSENERQDYYQVLQESSNRLMQTITDFIDISMLASGTMEVNKSKVNLKVLMDAMHQKVLNLCSKKKIAVEPVIPDNEDEKMLYTDGELLRKALGHLIDNSAKFTVEGSIRFGYNYGQEDITFFVSDTGAGISGDKLTNIFNVFTQGDTSISRGYEGTGLGLSIIKGIVTLLGGKIRVESEVKKGTTIFFTIPNQTVELKTIGFQPPLFHGAFSGKPLILIAEDDEPNYFYIRMVLEKSGYATIRSTNGAETVTMCSQNPDVSLVLMDIKMPVMNGIEATKAIREFDLDLPIIAITAYAQSGDENHIMNAGCSGYLSKPVKREELLQLLSKFLIKSDELQ